MKYYIEIINKNFGSIISYIELYGSRKDLTKKLTNFDFVKSIGMPEVYLFEQFKLLNSQELHNRNML